MSDQKVRNTTAEAERDPLSTLIATMGSGGIERQEAQGQRQLAASSQLPTDGLTPEWAAECGITIAQPSDGDPLFTDVQLPEGWAIKPTEHSMWSDLVDADGEKRAAIFYKAAFYDRRAFLRPESR